MIPRETINAWRNSKAPWITNEQVEQDFIISQALVELFKDDLINSNLLFRGGTALNKLFLFPAARYSEDIDLVQVKETPIGQIIDKVKERLSYLGIAKVKQKRNNNTLLFRIQSEIPPVMDLRLKVEINCREHFTVFGKQQMPFSVETKIFSGDTLISTYTIEELMATKLRALYQRKKGRDLFDLWHVLTTLQLDCEKVIHAFRLYLECENIRISSKEFLQNVEEKIKMADFFGDTSGLLRSNIEYDHEIAFEQVKAKLLLRL